MLPSFTPFLSLLNAVLGALSGLRRWSLLLLGLAVAAFVVATLQPGPAPIDDGRPAHVLIIGIDGLTARALAMGNTPTLDFLAAEGARPVRMRAVLPTLSSPNWATHLMGAGPEAHGIADNQWRPRDWRGTRHCGQEEGERWPTLFDVISDQRLGARTAAIYDWRGLGRIIPRRSVDRRAQRSRPAAVTRVAARHIRRKAPLLTFVQLDHVDKAGHAYGFDAWQYHRAVAEADGYVDALLNALEDGGILEDTLVVVISDHGGIGRGHRYDTPEEVEVPWILWGQGVTPGALLPGDFTVRDTAPTVAFALGLATPDCWTGTAIKSAFTF